MADFGMTLHNPLTDDEWDLITDASLDNTKEITFVTKQDKEVKFIKASADVVKVVRCKDCKYYGTKFCKIDIWHKDVTIYRAKDDDYCSYGERRTDGNT